MYAEKRGHVVNELIVDNFIANGSVAMVRRNCLPKPEPFDPEQLGNEDFYFYLRIAAEYKVEVVPEFLVGYRWNTGANKSWNIKRQYASYYQMLGKIRVHYPQVSKRAIDKSIACFNLGMARLFFKREKYKEAFLLFISTVIRNPSCLTAPPFYRLIGLVVRWTLRKVASAQCPQVAFLQSNTKAFKLLTVSEA